MTAWLIALIVVAAALAVVAGLLLRSRGQHRSGERRPDRVDRMAEEGLAYSRDMEMLLRADQAVDDRDHDPREEDR